MKHVKITIPGQPIAKMRARVKQVRNKIWSFDPQEKEKQNTKQQLKREIENLGSYFELDQLFCFGLNLFFEPSKSWTAQKKAHCIWGIEKPTKSDLDNLLKFYQDCANGILYNDDKQIVKILFCEAFYSYNPRAEITIMPYIKFNLNTKDLNTLGIFDPNKLKEFISDVQKISKLDTESIDNLEGDYKQQWLASSSSLLTDFSNKYADDLKKIKSFESKKRKAC